MAIIKVYFRKSAKKLIEYVEREGKPGDPVSAIGCDPESAASDFAATKRASGSKGTNEALHVIQSWGEEESKKHPAGFFNELGQKLVEEYFKGHEAIIKTHTDTGKIHNHIVVNMVNHETGKMLENKKYHLHKLRDLNDKICLANGLSVINREAKERRARLPDKVLRMERFNRFSYIFDTKQKADFARKYATGYDEYVAILGQLGVAARVENKNITYYYPGIERGKRGDKLGRPYNKTGLEEAFQKNHEMFSQHPHLRAEVAGKIHGVVSGQHPLNEKKDFTAFTKVSRGNERSSYPFETLIQHSMLPLDEIRRARTGSILEYCKRNKMELGLNGEGRTVLKRRPFVLVTDNEWVNSKNKTRGTLIEFVAAHRQTTFIKAIAEINGNPRLLLLEQQFGEQKRTFTSFYFPKNESMDWKDSLGHFGRFLSSMNCNPKVGESLLKKQQVQVGKNGIVRLFGKDDPGGALEFVPEANGNWSRSRRGTITSPFFASRGSGKTAVVYTDPISLVQHHGKDLFSTGTRPKGLLGLLEPSNEAVDHYIARNRQVKELLFVLPPGKKKSAQEIDFFGNLKKRYLEFGIKVRDTPTPPDLHRDAPTLSR
jgi:hypothetical protein